MQNTDGGEHEPAPLAGSPTHVVLGDQDVIDDDVLRRGRLRGSLARGDQWRRRAEVRVIRRLALSLVVAVISVVLVGAVGFVRVKLAQQAEQKRQQQERMGQLYAPSGPTFLRTPMPTRTR